jgi:hypothetical protein
VRAAGWKKNVSDHRAPHLPRYRPAHVHKYTSQADALHLRCPVIAYRMGAKSNPLAYPVSGYKKSFMNEVSFFNFLKKWYE